MGEFKNFLLDKLWRESGVSELLLDDIRHNAWNKTKDFTIEEAFYLCDSLRESFDLPPLSQAAIAAAEALSIVGISWAFCGGTAINVLVEPRTTKDVDILVADRSDAMSKLLQTNQFHAEGGKLKHISGGEIDILNWESGNLDCPKETAKKSLSTATTQRMWGKNVFMVSPAGVIAMKLGRAITNDAKAYQDKGDIIRVLMKYGYQDLSKYNLTQKMINEYEKLAKEVKN